MSENSTNIIEINNSEQFNECLKFNNLTIVDFWAEWCGPCRMMLPVLHKIAWDHPELQLLTVNVDECPDIAWDQKFWVSSIPAIFFMRNWEIVDWFVWALPEDEVLKKITANSIIESENTTN